MIRAGAASFCGSAGTVERGHFPLKVTAKSQSGAGAARAGEDWEAVVLGSHWLHSARAQPHRLLKKLQMPDAANGGRSSPPLYSQ